MVFCGIAIASSTNTGLLFLTDWCFFKRYKKTRERQANTFLWKNKTTFFILFYSYPLPFVLIFLVESTSFHCIATEKPSIHFPAVIYMIWSFVCQCQVVVVEVKERSCCPNSSDCILLITDVPHRHVCLQRGDKEEQDRYNTIAISLYYFPDTSCLHLDFVVKNYLVCKVALWLPTVVCATDDNRKEDYCISFYSVHICIW